MTTNIRIKKSSVPGNIPSPELLEYGEIAINFADGKLYYKNSLNEVKAFIDSDAIATIIAAVSGGNALSNIADSDTGLAVSGDLLPNGDAIYDLGSPTRKWKDLHLSSNTLYLAGVSLGYENNTFTVRDSSGTITQINPASLTSITSIIDSDYVVARQGVPAFANVAQLANTVDSNFLISFIDSDYVASKVNLAYAGNAAVQNYKFIADSDQTVFSGLSYNNQFVQVYLNGVLLLDSDDYVKSGNDTITVLQALGAGDQLVVSDFTSFFTNQTVDSAYINNLVSTELNSIGSSDISTFKFISGSGQTVFTGSDVNSNTLDIDTSGIQVFLNGILLQQTDDYTATTDTVTLTEAALENSHLIVQSFKRYFNLTGLDSADVIQIVTDAGITGASGLDSDAVINIIAALDTPQDFAYSSLTGAPNILDSAAVVALQIPQDFAYSSLTGTPNVLDSAQILASIAEVGYLTTAIDSNNVTSLITAYNYVTQTEIDSAIDALVAGAPAALDTLNELATQLNNDSNALSAITNTLTLKLNIADVVPQDFAYGSLTGAPNVLDSADVIALQTPQIPQDFAYASLTGTPNILDSADVIALQTPQDFAYASLTDTPSILDSANVIALQTPQDFAYASLTGTPYIFDSATVAAIAIANALDSAMIQSIIDDTGIDSAAVTGIVDAAYVQALSPLQDFAYASLTGTPNITSIVDSAINALVDGAPAALDTLAELAVQLNNDSDAIAAVVNTLALKLNIADVVPQDFAYGSLTGTPNVLDSANVIALQTPQDFAYASLTGTPTLFDGAYSSLTGTPNILDSANVIALQTPQTPQDFAYASLTGAPNILDSANVSTLITTAVDALVAGAPAALDTLAELATQLNNDSDAIVAVVNTLALKLNIADVVAQDFAYTSLTGTPNILDSANVIALQTPQDFAYASLTGTPNILDSANVIALQTPQDFAYASLTGAPVLLDSAAVALIADANGPQIDSATITSIIDSDYVASRAALAFAGSASVSDTKFIADSGQTVFTGLSYNDQFVQVHLNGVLLVDSDDYTKSGNDTITTTYLLNAGDQLVVSDFTSFFTNTTVTADTIHGFIDSALSSTGSSDITQYKFIASASQSVFTGNDYNGIALNYDATGIQVFLNGVILIDSDDYQMIDNNTLTLTNPVEAGDQLKVISYKRYFNYVGLDSADVIQIVTDAGISGSLDSAAVIALQTPQDFAYTSLTGAPNVLDSANVIALQTPQDFAYASLTGSPNITSIVDSAINALVDGAPGALDTLAELATQLNNDSDAIAAIVTNLALKLNIADVVPQDFAYGSLTGTPSLFDGNYASLANLPNILDSANVVALQTPQDFAYTSLTGAPTLFDGAYSSLTGAPNVLDSANVIALQTPQDFAYGSLTGAPNVLDSANVTTIIDAAYIQSNQIVQDFAYASLTGSPNITSIIDSAINALVDGAPGALDTLAELATQLNNDSDAIAAIVTNLALKLNIADVVPQDFAYASLTGTPTLFDGNYASLANLPNILDSADVIALSPPQDFAYGSLTGTPNILDSANVIAIHNALGGVDSAAITSMIDSDYVASRVTLAFAGNAAVQDYKFIADSDQTVFTGLSYNDQFVQVHLNGVLLLNTDDYSLSGGDTVTLLQPLVAGDQLVVSDFTSFFSYTSIDSATVTAIAGAATSPYNSTEFTSSAGQDTFSVNYTIGRIAVYINGVKLSSADYTATNGTSVVLDIALTAGNTVEIVDHGVAYATNGGISTGKAIAMALVFGG